MARISLLQGDVSVRRGDSGEWVAAAPNAPLVVQDRLITGGGASLAEVQLDYSNLVRVASNAEVRFAELEYGRFILQLAAGTATYRMLRDSNAEVELSTPNAAVHPLRRGLYRVTILPDDTTEITVRSGEVDIYTPRGSERLRAGRTMLVRGTPDAPEFQVTAAIPRDDWDQWNERRDQDLERSASYRYVNPSIAGAEDLDNYGNWVYDAPYGYVWAPRVAVDWAPYRYGRWSWIDYFGWTWVSNDPWGWAPYHYGRWYQGPRGWCWWPGAMQTRHYWSPGLVAFVGFGGGVGVNAGFGFGNVGWVPLAPFEPYHPWYGRGYYGGRNNVNNVNIVNNINITNVYRNARVHNGITAVNTGDFGSGHNNFVRLNQGDLQRANLVRGQLPLAPDRNSQQVSGRSLGFTPHSRDNERFYSRQTPSAVQHVSFEDQRRGIQDLSRRTFGGGGQNAPGMGTLPGTAEAVGSGWRQSAQPGSGSGIQTHGSSAGPVNSDAGRGWRRFGDPGSATSPATSNPSAGAGRSTTRENGWRAFGDPSTGRRADATRGSAARQPGRDRNSGQDTAPDRSGWRSFGAPGASAPVTQTHESFASPSSENPRQSSPSQWQPMSRRGAESGAGQPLRLSPPIVRERPRGDSNYSAPSRPQRFESPPSAPRGGFQGGGHIQNAPPSRSGGEGVSRGGGPAGGGGRGGRGR
ncbi:MAG: hypothetical protein LC126_18340 [Bryobacterales bacterium]|nr:hypothetical protein [Bryobacterales bacterium]